MKFQVDEIEYLALLQLKSTVDIVVKLWETDELFVTPEALLVLRNALSVAAKEVPEPGANHAPIP